MKEQSDSNSRLPLEVDNSPYPRRHWLRLMRDIARFWWVAAGVLVTSALSNMPGLLLSDSQLTVPGLWRALRESFLVRWWQQSPLAVIAVVIGLALLVLLGRLAARDRDMELSYLQARTRSQELVQVGQIISEAAHQASQKASEETTRDNAKSWRRFLQNAVRGTAKHTIKSELQRASSKIKPDAHKSVKEDQNTSEIQQAGDPRDSQSSNEVAEPSPAQNTGDESEGATPASGLLGPLPEETEVAQLAYPPHVDEVTSSKYDNMVHGITDHTELDSLSDQNYSDETSMNAVIDARQDTNPEELTSDQTAQSIQDSTVTLGSFSNPDALDAPSEASGETHPLDIYMSPDNQMESENRDRTNLEDADQENSERGSTLQQPEPEVAYPDEAHFSPNNKASEDVLKQIIDNHPSTLIGRSLRDRRRYLGLAQRDINYDSGWVEVIENGQWSGYFFLPFIGRYLDAVLLTGHELLEALGDHE